MSRAGNDGPSRRLIDWIAPAIELGQPQCFLATTFDLDPDFIETDFLPALLGIPARDDASVRSRAQLELALGRVDHAVLLTEGTRFRGRPKSMRLRVTPAVRGNGGVLHAKIALLVYPEAVRLIVASANLTSAGYRMNREVAIPLTATVKQPEDGRLIRQALDGAEQLLAPWWSEEAAAVVSAAREQLKNLKAPQPKKADDEALIWGGAQPLWEQFLAMWPKREVIQKISIVSPFWSEAVEGGPIDQLVRELKARKLLAKRCAVALIAAPAPASITTYLPQLHSTYGAFDFGAWGIDVTAAAASPRVDPQDVSGSEVLRERALHAKVVLFQGADSALAYLGSANFTRRGWGFNGAGANIEAGVCLRRAGKDRKVLENLLPPLAGSPVALDGSGTCAFIAPQTSDGVAPWPDFIVSVELGLDSDPEQRKLTIFVDPDKAPGAWRLAFARHMPGKPIESVERVLNFPLTQEELRVLWREQVVFIHWAATGDGEGVAFPVNAAASLRHTLPLGDPNNLPSEQDLLAFYQGRIDAEEAGHGLEREAGAGGLSAPERTVDTSTILSYQVRSFVEALPGIKDEIARSVVNGATIRLALLGPISPVELARQIRAAVASEKRSHTAGGFQLVELLALLRRCELLDVDERLQDVWMKSLNEARQLITGYLEEVRSHGGPAIAARSPFAAYERVALPARPDRSSP